MNYMTITHEDMLNGYGLREVLWVAGCEHHCPECHNPETWDFKGGKEFTNDTIKTILDLCNRDYIKGLSILGGEPMHPTNIDGTTELAKAFKEKFPNKNIWVWSGFNFEKDLKEKEVLKYIDVLIDGQYVDELHDPTLKWRGSSNQRVIDVKKSLKDNKTILMI